MTLSPIARSAIRAVLRFEVAVNVINGGVSVVAPALALQSMTNCALAEGADSAGGSQGVGLEAQRWFGVMGAVFGGFLLARVLALDEPRALRPLLEALLLGDVAYLASLVPFAMRFGVWPAAAAPFALTAVMFAARATLLLGEDWPAAFAAAAERQLAAAAAEASGDKDSGEAAAAGAAAGAAAAP